MGFTPETTTIKLNFSGSALEGLEVVTHSVSVGVYNKLIGGESLSVFDSNAQILDQFLTALVSWNLEVPAGRPVPKTKKGVERIESNTLSEILSAWMVALTSVPTKYPTRSNGTRPPNRLEESSLGLEGLSESPGS